MQRFVLALTILGSLTCWSGAQEAEKSPAPVNFEEHVFPIFRQHCLQCHNANDAEAGLALDSFGALMEGSGSGDVVAEGDSGSSRLYLVMTHDEEPAMPPDQDPIPAEQLDIIKRWIDGGLLENSGSKAKNEKVHHCRFYVGQRQARRDHHAGPSLESSSCHVPTLRRRNSDCCESLGSVSGSCRTETGRSLSHRI